jgi:hypothetical protein
MRVNASCQTQVIAMFLIRFAISLFALSLLGMAFSLSAHSQSPAPTAIVMVR